MINKTETCMKENQIEKMQGDLVKLVDKVKMMYSIGVRIVGMGKCEYLFLFILFCINGV